jgi:inositol 1,4,5-triphosphate receptor type 3
MEESETILKILKHEEMLRILFNKNPILALFANHRMLWEQCVFISTLSINFMILMSYSQYYVVDTPGNRHEDIENARLNEPRIFFNI